MKWTQISFSGFSKKVNPVRFSRHVLFVAASVRQSWTNARSYMNSHVAIIVIYPN
jgi:hypothetical protein